MFTSFIIWAFCGKEVTRKLVPMIYSHCPVPAVFPIRGEQSIEAPSFQMSCWVSKPVGRPLPIPSVVCIIIFRIFFHGFYIMYLYAFERPFSTCSFVSFANFNFVLFFFAFFILFSILRKRQDFNLCTDCSALP